MSTNTVSIQSNSTGPSLEDEAAALEASKVAEGEPKAELAGEAPEETPDRPEWLPEKFKTAEDLAKAYAELEKGKPSEAAEVADQAIEAAGLDMDALSAEYAEKGELTPESLDALAKQGITPEMVDSYVAGQEAQNSAARSALLEPVGGEEAYTEMVTWAAENLSEGDIKAFNNVLASGNADATKMAVENLHAKYKTENGEEPSRQLSGKGVKTSSTRYESTADLMKDMNNPEYATNEAFRNKVAQKLQRSSIM